ncbi:MAG: NEAT domain-containing protein, partial [Lachnospiraceae bacterium]|nr:NEAT domain-containing protein [Lachnospiraceae bacterium]
MTRIDLEVVDKTGLNELLNAALALSGREGQFTKESLAELMTAIRAAQGVGSDADRETVNALANALSQAIMNLKAVPDSTGSGNGNNNTDNSNNNNTGSGDDNHTNTGDSSLDRYNLADGVYSITGKMVKIDKTSTSMANAALNHTVKLTVFDGKYYLTLDFTGLTYAGQYGYLGWMKYYKTGYGLDRYKNPTGSLGDVVVDSLQMNTDGSLVSDMYGTNYPNQVTFPLIGEGVEDGYVPLQVYVP